MYTKANDSFEMIFVDTPPPVDDPFAGHDLPGDVGIPVEYTDPTVYAPEAYIVSGGPDLQGLNGFW